MKKASKENERGTKKTGKVLECRLLENKLVIAKGFEELMQKSYGKYIGDENDISKGRLEISFVEALYLLEKGKINIKKGTKKLSFKELMEFGIQRDKRLHEKYMVYRDIRERGLVAKTGFKFGCDFRVYQRGVGVKKGPKTASEHTKWIVYTVPEDYTCSFAELSRAVRLAHSIRARMLWAIVDNEDNVTYFEVVRIKP
ncbi:MAG: tRNA-intron lyase [Candidatus Aenigmatarchaeota archaeon]